MASIGPELPAHLSKRKRTPEEEDDASRASPPAKQQKNKEEIDIDGDSSEDDYGPSAPISTIGPSIPPPNADKIDLSESDSDSDTGPAPFQTTGPVRPEANPAITEEESSDSEDDFGPSLPSSSIQKPRIGPSLPATTIEAAPTRDSWMIRPPSPSGIKNSDPTALRARKFSSKPQSSAASSTLSSIWTETPEEKLQRLQNSVLGREDANASSATPTAQQSREAARRHEEQRRISAAVDAQRGQSLYNEHQQKRELAGKKEEEDDPSKRGFDREKDMAIGGRIDGTKRREMMTHAANFGGKFQKGSFL